MNIKEILETHELFADNDPDPSSLTFKCSGCDWKTEYGEHGIARHIEHISSLINEQMYSAWSEGWHNCHYQHTAHNEHHGLEHPEVLYSNPYRVSKEQNK